MNGFRLATALFHFVWIVPFCTGENPQGCNGYFKEKEGNITSPNYPSIYPDDADCTYVIGIQTLSNIWIRFNDVQFETGFDCLYYGTGRIADINKAERKIGGTNKPDQFKVVTDSGVWFQLITDSGVGYRGFSLSWTIEDYCGGIYTENTGMLTSPNYPGFYPSNIDCVYTVKLNRTSRIQITAQTFLLETEHDRLQYGIGDDDFKNVLGYLTGLRQESSLVLDVVADVLWLRFTSDYAVEHAGFNMSWEASVLPTTTPSMSSSESSSSPLDGNPDAERQRKQNDIVLKIVAGTVIGAVALILIVVVGLACFYRFNKSQKTTPPPPIQPTVEIGPRESPSGISMDRLPQYIDEADKIGDQETNSIQNETDTNDEPESSELTNTENDRISGTDQV